MSQPSPQPDFADVVEEGMARALEGLVSRSKIEEADRIYLEQYPADPD